MSPGFPPHKQTPQTNSYSCDWYFVSFALQDLVCGDFGGAEQQEVRGPQGFLVWEEPLWRQEQEDKGFAVTQKHLMTRNERREGWLRGLGEECWN